MTFQDIAVDFGDSDVRMPNKFFDSLVRNAIDFLKKSVDELEKSPKYSVINFYAAIELFLKARLLAEHWTLIVSDINKVQKKAGETTLSKFEAGELSSVGLKKCIERLNDICSIQIPFKASEYFDNLRKHRNKMIHFFHPDYSEATSLATIVPEQWSAWYHLHRLIIDEWWDHFQQYEEEIEDVHSLVCGNWKYLEAKYREIEPQIEKEKRASAIFHRCSICGYEAARFSDLYGMVYSNSCMICHHQDNKIHISCPECSCEIIIIDQAVGECGNCGFETDFDFLLSQIGPYQDPKEDPVVAYCAECEYPEPSVIPVSEYDEEGLCLNCNTLHDSRGHCRYCNELIAGMDLEASYSSGCILCDGAFGADDS
jgi:hypothetical protein